MRLDTLSGVVPGTLGSSLHPNQPHRQASPGERVTSDAQRNSPFVPTRSPMNTGARLSPPCPPIGAQLPPGSTLRRALLHRLCVLLARLCFHGSHLPSTGVRVRRQRTHTEALIALQQIANSAKPNRVAPERGHCLNVRAHALRLGWEGFRGTGKLKVPKAQGCLCYIFGIIIQCASVSAANLCAHYVRLKQFF